MPIFQYSTELPQPRELVWAWHERPGALTRLTPPGVATTVRGSDAGIRDGSLVTLRISDPVLTAALPRLPVRGTRSRAPVGLTWTLRHAGVVAGEQFDDVQLRGPFRAWHHEHRFEDGSAGGTRITDRITWEPPRLAAPLGQVIEERVHAFLARLFEFRAAQLRGDLDTLERLGEPRRVLLAGGSGLIGTQLRAALTAGGHEVLRLVRRGARQPEEIEWAPAERDLPPEALDGVDAVIALSGRTIGGRFTASAKQEIRDSRLDAVGTLAGAIAARAADARPASFVQASGVSYYGAQRHGETLDEDAAPGSGFLAELARDWEQASAVLDTAGVRRVALRTGIVLSGQAGALAPQLPLFALGLGGRLSDADASVSWIGLDDITRAYLHAVAEPSLTGPANAVAPGAVTWQEFAETLGRVLHRPAVLPTPAFGPQLVLGREGADELIRTDQHVVPAKLDVTGFAFAQPTLDEALRHALLR